MPEADLDIIANAMETGVLRLIQPIELPGIGEVTSFQFQKKMKARHWRALPLGALTYDNVLHLAGKLTGQPDIVIDELGFEDMQNVVLMVTSFLTSGQPKSDATG